jgi:sugar (glycoside-pentoside-hexuronide) transporter
MPRKLKDGYNVGLWEKTSYGLYFFGQNIFYGLVAFNVQTLYSDAGITAATVALILLITKIWDAVNDPIFGIFIDKIRFKKGRFLPWLRISLPFIAITSIWMFALPYNGSMTLKIIWATASYVAWDMSYTLCDVPIFVLPMSMTDNIKERTGILSIGRYLGGIGIMGTMVVVPTIQAKLGWLMTGLVLSILGALFCLPICLSGKERHIVRPTKEVTLKQMFQYVASNKYLLIFYLSLFICNLTNFGLSMGIFFARYNLGNQALASIISMSSVLPMLIIGAIIPLLIRKIDKFHMFFFSCVSTGVLGLVRYFVGYSNFTVFMVMAMIQGITSSAWGILLYMFTPDCLEYGTYHSGKRAEGSAASIQTFFVKLMGSVSGPLAMIIIAAFGFVAGEDAVQPETAKQGIWLCMTVFPAIGLAIGLLLLRTYKLRDKDVQIMAKYNNGLINKEEADAQLAAKYGPAAVLDEMTITSDA